MKLFKKKESQATKNKKEIRGLDRKLTRLMTLLGVEYKYSEGFLMSVYSYFRDDSPQVILQEKVDLILDHLGLEYESKEERIEGIEGRLYKKPRKKGEPIKTPVIYHKRGIGGKR